MGKIQLFRTERNVVSELFGESASLEKSLQELLESHLDAFFGIRFLESEYSTGKTHSGRIDSLGIDEDGCPCILEYKRLSNENVINQGLFYLDWLMDHKGEFELLVLRKYGQEVADSIEWSSPRLLCIAGDFTKYDAHAVQQINRNIELYRYVRFGEELLLLELANAVQATSASDLNITTRTRDKTLTEQIELASPQLIDVFEKLRATLLGMGSDVQEKQLKHYVAFKRIKNFATVAIFPNQEQLLVWVKINPASVTLEPGFIRDVSQIGHWGTGDLEITLKNMNDLEKAIHFLEKSYEGS